MKNLRISALAIAAATFLAACSGGGGGEDAPASAPTPPVVVPDPKPVAIPADIQTSVPALSYSPESEAHKFVTAFNAFRSQVGYGLLSQNPLLDKAASNHLEYVLKNDVTNGGTVDMQSFDAATGRPMFHIESGDKPLFTGVQEHDRAKAAGYAGAYVGELGTYGGSKGAAMAFATLTSTIYHRAGLMLEGPREVGIALGQDKWETFVVEVGYATPQRNASDFFGVYPSSGQTGVGLHTGVETPNPFPELSTANADFPTKTGYPVSVVSKFGTTIEVLSFTLTEAGATEPLAAHIMTKDNDPQRYLAGNMVFLVAKAPLKTTTSYTAKFSGRVSNAAVSREWSFTTGTKQYGG